MSRYTCGFAKVKMAAIDIVGKSPFDFDATISIFALLLKAAFNLRIPYPNSQRAEKLKSQLDCWLMKLFKKNDIPVTPTVINKHQK